VERAIPRRSAIAAPGLGGDSGEQAAIRCNGCEATARLSNQTSNIKHQTSGVCWQKTPHLPIPSLVTTIVRNALFNVLDGPVDALERCDAVAPFVRRGGLK